MEFKKLYLGQACADNGAFSHFVFVDDEGNQIGIFCDENASFCTEQEKAYAKLFAAAPDMYAGNEDAMITLDLMARRGGLICAECPWEKKCKTCALSEILRLEIGLRKRIETIQKKARGEE